MSTFMVQIVTPDGTIYNQEAKFLVANTVAGSLGVLPNHAPLIAPLKIAGLRVDRVETGSDWVAVNGGIIEIRDNIVSVLANSAETEETIDVSRAEQAKKRAEANLARAKSDHEARVDMNRAEIALHRAINRLDVASKKR